MLDAFRPSKVRSRSRLVINWIFLVCCTVLAAAVIVFLTLYFREATETGKSFVDVLKDTMPNVVKTSAELWKCLGQTLEMLLWTTLFSTLFGLLFGVTLIVTQRGKILECPPIFHTLDKLINLFRSIPFIVLVSLLIPATRALVGTSIGVTGAIFPLVVATVPFLSRQVHSALCSVDDGVIEAARSMGMRSASIIFKVYLKEGLPAIIRGLTITIVNIIGLSAMAGTVGAGGLGDYAIRYGYQRVMTDVTIVTILIILLLVTIIQAIGTLAESLLTH